METRTGFRITPQVVLGLIIIAVGAILTLDRLDILYAREYLRYWPALLIIYGVSKFSQPAGSQGRWLGVLIAFVGTALLVDKLDFLDFRVWDFWPLILVAFGIALLWRATTRSTTFGVAKQEDSSSYVKDFAFWSGIEQKNTSQDFRGGEVTAIMGGCELDLRGASIRGEAVLDVFAFWGGIELKVPSDWSVHVAGTPILGGIEDKSSPPPGGTTKRLVIRGTVVMGGLEIHN